MQVNTASSELSPGNVHVALRPETITVTQEGADGVLLRGTVTESTFFGAGSQMLIRLDDGSEVHAQVDRPSEAGSRVGLKCDSNDLHVLAD